MSESAPAAAATGAARDESAPDDRRGGLLAPWVSRDELRVGAIVVVALAVLGALLGILWQQWSPPGPLGLVLAPHAIEADQTEAFVAADGRFAVIAAVVGLLAGVGVWRYRRTRGPVAVAALAVGGVVGGLLTALVGRLLDSGTDSGAPNTLIRHLPLSVHLHGLYALEAAVGVLVYTLCVAFAPDDDLGRPDGARSGPAGSPPAVGAPWPVGGPPSVGVGDQLQDGGGHTDAAGGLQQRYFPPQ